jgi:hypothetical protein
MKTRITRTLSQVAFLAAALVASCFAGATANAQTAFKGKFTLPYEVRWGKAVLSPGEYTLSMTASDPGDMMIEDARTGQTVAHLIFPSREDAGPGGSALLIGTRGQQLVVHSFRVAELRTTFVCDPSLAHPRRSREEARQSQAVPVLQAKN